MKQLVRFGKPIFRDVIVEEYYRDDCGNLYGKTGKKMKVGQECIGYDFEGVEWQEEEIPIIECRAGIEIKP